MTQRLVHLLDFVCVCACAFGFNVRTMNTQTSSTKNSNEVDILQSDDCDICKYTVDNSISNYVGKGTHRWYSQWSESKKLEP